MDLKICKLVSTYLACMFVRQGIVEMLEHPGIIFLGHISLRVTSKWMLLVSWYFNFGAECLHITNY